MPTVSAEVGNAKCSDIMRMYLKIDNDIITDVKFKTFGCGAAVATSSMATELIKGKSVKDALKLTNKAVIEALGRSAARKGSLFRCLPRMLSRQLSRTITTETGLKMILNLPAVPVLPAAATAGLNTNEARFFIDICNAAYAFAVCLCTG